MASAATSSRRRPGVRRRAVTGIPTSAGWSASRWRRRKSASAARSIPPLSAYRYRPPGIADPPISALCTGHGPVGRLNDMNISGNTIFIPGSTSGIGLALALALEASGNTVIVGGRRADLLAKIAAEHPGIDTVVIDTADGGSIQSAAKQVLNRHPDLNVLVTMAGIMRVEDWHKPEAFLASAESVLTTNVLGPVRLIAAFIEHLRNRPDATIITVSSGLAFTPLAVTPSYNASKAAIHLLSESIRLQLEDTTVRVVELEPPSVRTALMPGQEDSEFAMPLDEFIAEVMGLLKAQPDAKEIQVERVKFLRYGEARGDYDQVVAVLKNPHPHAKKP